MYNYDYGYWQGQQSLLIKVRQTSIWIECIGSNVPLIIVPQILSTEKSFYWLHCVMFKQWNVSICTAIEY